MVYVIHGIWSIIENRGKIRELLSLRIINIDRDSIRECLMFVQVSDPIYYFECKMKNFFKTSTRIHDRCYCYPNLKGGAFLRAVK